jgi:hypothetical protein
LPKTPDAAFRDFDHARNWRAIPQIALEQSFHFGGGLQMRVRAMFASRVQRIGRAIIANAGHHVL